MCRYIEAERLAMAEERGLWGIMNAVGERSIPVSDYVRNYMQLLPWWNMREGIIEDFRRWQREGVARHVMVPRIHHDEIVRAASTGATITVLVDLQPKDPFLILGVMRNVSYGGDGLPPSLVAAHLKSAHRNRGVNSDIPTNIHDSLSLLSFWSCSFNSVCEISLSWSCVFCLLHPSPAVDLTRRHSVPVPPERGDPAPRHPPNRPRAQDSHRHRHPRRNPAPPFQPVDGPRVQRTV